MAIRLQKMMLRKRRIFRADFFLSSRTPFFCRYMEALKKESRFVTKNIVTGMSAIDQRWGAFHIVHILYFAITAHTSLLKFSGVKTNKNHLPTSEMYKLIGR